jgi:general secretion pathway protein G
MGNFSLAFVLAGSLLAFTDLPQQMKQIFDDSILAGQQIATAGDLRSISTMLDVYYLQHGAYPAEDRFAEWLAATFKEGNLKDLASDHWGHPFMYSAPPGRKAFLLQSGGADGIVGTADDMKVTGP